MRSSWTSCRLRISALLYTVRKRRAMSKDLEDKTFVTGLPQCGSSTVSSSGSVGRSGLGVRLKDKHSQVLIALSLMINNMKCIYGFNGLDYNKLGKLDLEKFHKTTETL